MESETVHDAYDTSSQSFNILATSLKSKVHAPDFLQATLSTASTASATPAAKYEYVPFGMGRIRVVCCSLLWKLLQQRAAFVWVMYYVYIVGISWIGAPSYCCSIMRELIESNRLHETGCIGVCLYRPMQWCGSLIYQRVYATQGSQWVQPLSLRFFHPRVAKQPQRRPADHKG